MRRDTRPVNYRFTAPELEYQIGHCDAEVMILEEMWLPEVQKAKPKLKKIRKFICSAPTARPTWSLTRS